jgi:hypothetical protein
VDRFSEGARWRAGHSSGATTLPSGEPAAFQNSFWDKNSIIKKAQTETVQAFLVGVAAPMLRGNLLYLMIFKQKKALNFRLRLLVVGEANFNA